MEEPSEPSESNSDENTEAHRDAQPVDTEAPPRLPFPVVGIGASAGGLEAATELLTAVRRDSGMAYIFIQHLPPTGESLLVEIFSKRVAIPVQDIDDQTLIEPNRLYVTRPGRTLSIKDGRFHVGEELARPMGNRPIDDFFKSLAEEQRERAVAIILSGMGSNGTAGAQAIKAVGGLCIAQEPETAQFPSMPRHLIDAGYADYILRPSDMADVLLGYADHPYARGEREEGAELEKRDQQHLREILSVLRTRTRQDFSGYKKPTILRRVQRRMGINRMTKLGHYSKFLRQNPMEVTALSDDLLIHVTGFFRDPEAWERLRKEVIVPLVASREDDGAIRCWVTACSSGEEAYSLAMLLVDECEKTDKPLDIKVFATDLAERTLQSARSGIYAGGIEAEIEPRLLARFFQRDEAVYRVRQDLRERVVFAPQNLLQDPPFSRLDIATCRNLLIYLEPNVQQRILSLLHFGLREGGALFLGTSETVGSEELFRVVDKKYRIYQRVGPTRHSSVEFPLPRKVGNLNRGGDADAVVDRRPAPPRTSLAQLTARALLDQHVPAAVTIDRDNHIVYFHGDLDPYITSPRGEPTRNLLDLARESVRGAVRVAVHRAKASNASVAVPDGWITSEDGTRVRVEVVVSPLEHKDSADFFVVSFQKRAGSTQEDEDKLARHSNRESAEELQRIRDELQSTIEELQTSNEELKASHEEVVSTNEELQSTNEELETSREEMQSLNEELSTVNSQLHVKMEEHQASSNDLASLISSTDIAVLFLDPQLRIRRFTAAMRRLMDLIPSDMGRPFNDMARKFEDPTLLQDAQNVLENLVSIEKEIVAEDHHWYLRRVLPYRTTDNRITGVVITFLDVNERRRAEEAVRESRAWLQGQKEAFQAAIRSQPLAESLGVLVETVIKQVDGESRAAFYMIPPTGEGLEHVVGMSDAYARAIKELKVSPESLAYGSSIHSGEPVITPDVEQDPRWKPWRNLARDFDYRACWLFPVQTEVGSALGTFALYSRNPRRPTPRELEVAAVMAHTAAIIISRHIQALDRAVAQAALRASEERYRFFFESMDESFSIVEMIVSESGSFIDYRIVETNAAFLLHSGLINPVGRTASELIPGLEAEWIEMFGRVATSRKPERFTMQIASLRQIYDVFAFPVGEPAQRRVAVLANNVTVQKQADLALRTSRATAEEANRLKDDFLATLSHELRTPLSSILLWTNLLRDNPEAKPFAEALDSILSSAHAQKTLIEDLLDMSRITNGTLRLVMQDVDLVQTIRQSIEDVAGSAKQKSIELHVNLDSNVGTVHAAEDRVRQILWNLLSNAIKFTPPGGKIDLAARRLDGHVEMKVSDTGIGIAPEFLAYIFERFRQADSSHTRAVGGLGLGLAIVRQLVELHGGKIQVQSPGINKGATFTVVLPLQKMPAHVNDAAAAADSGSHAANGSSALSGLMVLLVEDDPETRNAIKAVLTSAGLQVHATDTADAAMKAFKADNPDLIVSDIGLPGETGISLMRRIREHEATHGSDATPALALSAFAGDSARREALTVGFNLHLTKPIEPDQLLKAIKEIVQR